MAKRYHWGFVKTTVDLKDVPKGWTVYKTSTRRGRGRPSQQEQVWRAVEKERQKSPPGTPIRAIIHKLVTSGGRFHGRSETGLKARYYEAKRILK